MGLTLPALPMSKSDANVLLVFAAPLALCAADFFLLFADLFWLRETVLVDAGLMRADGSVVSCAEAAAGVGAAAAGVAQKHSEAVAAFLVMDKLPAACLGRAGVFANLPGQFVYVSVPSVSIRYFPDRSGSSTTVIDRLSCGPIT